MNKQKIILNTIHQNALDYSLEDFEQDAQKSAQAGATHLMISQVEKSRWIWEADRSDPYPNWGMLNLAVFKAVIPPELGDALPKEYAQRNLETLKKRAEIARKYGLKCAIQLCEPFYLPEKVYLAHPAWRGPRCEHPRRARNAYYSPCVDHPEVLALYRNAVAELLRQVEIDYIFLHTNDSGSGLCWSSGLYPGANGPSWCKHRSPAERISGFLGAFIDGARDAGREIDVEINSNIGFKELEHAMDSVWPFLKDHMAVNFKSKSGAPQTMMVDVGFEYSIAPVKNIPLVVGFLERLEAADKSPAPIASLILAPSEQDEYFRVLRLFNQKTTRGPAERAALLRRAALEIVGGDGEQADALLEAWYQIHNGLLHFTDSNIEGLVICSVNQRLINRPFVLFPAELSAEEKAYYRPFQFQANDEAQAEDLLNWQCTSFIRGYYAVFLASKALGRAMQANLVAIQALGNWPGGKLLAERLKVLNCFYRNVIHAMKFQDLIDSSDFSTPPEISPRWPIDADARLLEYEALTRAEIDNTLELADLLRGRLREMLITAPAAELEDIFLLSPDLLDQLERKVRIMLAHQLDGKRAFVTHNH